MIAAVSLVDVSVSTLRQLNDLSIAALKIGRSSPGDRRASVQNSVISVAMSGSIMPTPLAMPTTRAGPSPTTADAIFGTVSVVIIPTAARRASVPSKG